MKLTTIKEETRPIVKEIKAVKITNAEEMESACELLSSAKAQMKMIVEHENKVLDPLKEALKAKKAEWGPMKKVLKAGIETLGGVVGAYQTAEIKRVKIEEDRIAARMAKGTLKTSTAVRKLSEVEKPEAKVVTEAGSLSFRTDKKLRVVDPTLIPREYLIIDEKKLLDALKTGTLVPGAEVVEVQVAVNR